MKSHITPSRLVAALLTLTTLSAQAHTGHATFNLTEGLMHPFGVDHLLAMVAVGIWSVSTLPTRQAWQGPATFMLSLLVSAFLGAAGFTLPFLEHFITLSVVLFGAMLVLSSNVVPQSLSLFFIASAASLHGLAHGAEAPESGLIDYAMGFMFTTTMLHLGGMGFGKFTHNTLASRSTIAIKGIGAMLGLTGFMLFSQI